MRHYSELSPLEKKAREASGRIKCTDCPIYKLCKTSEMFIDACDFIYRHLKPGIIPVKRNKKIKKEKIICFASVTNPVNVTS